MFKAKSNRKIIRRERPLVVIATGGRQSLNEEVSHIIVERATEFGWDLLDLRFTGGALPEGREPSGILTPLYSKHPLRQRLEKLGCPLVWLSQGTLPAKPIPCVVPDLSAAGSLAAQHFAERGFRDVAYIGTTPWGDSSMLYDSFAQSAVKLGCKTHLLQVKEMRGSAGAEGHAYRKDIIGKWLKEQPKPLALLAPNDFAAARFCTICEEIGLAVPEDVSILGHGNTLSVCEMTPVKLSSILPDHEDYGRQATQLLQDLMGGKPTRETILIPPKGIATRQSTDMLAIGDHTVAKALRFIWDHLDQNISVDDIALEAGVNRRKLERAFSTHLHRGINAELRRKRFEKCRHLLRTTDTTISDICRQVGYRSRDYLYQTFQRELGMSPGQYRRQTGA